MAENEVRRRADRLLSLGAAIGPSAAGGIALARHGTQWGARASERAAELPGDTYMNDDDAAALRMTRAISVARPPEVVWRWLAQFGRGAGWYSIDGLDNGGRASARHLVSWIPEPRLGDATAAGALAHIDPCRSLTLVSPPAPFLTAKASLCMDFQLTEEGSGSRLVLRVSSDATGRAARPASWVFAAMDSVMSRQALLGIKRRAEEFGGRTSNPEEPETGARDQYQLYETIYVTGERAGAPGRDDAASARASRWVPGAD